MDKKLKTSTLVFALVILAGFAIAQRCSGDEVIYVRGPDGFQAPTVEVGINAPRYPVIRRVLETPAQVASAVLCPT